MTLEVRGPRVVHVPMIPFPPLVVGAFTKGNWYNHFSFPIRSFGRRVPADVREGDGIPETLLPLAQPREVDALIQGSGFEVEG